MKSNLGTRQGYPFSGDDPRLVRVVRSEETLTENHYRQRRLQPETTSHEWLWITTLDPGVFSAKQVRQLGHDRWKLENNGWNDLTQNWAFKHGYLHACRHRPSTRSADAARQLIPNRGLPAVTLILLLAFTLCAAFTLRHSKLFRRYRMPAIQVAPPTSALFVPAPANHPRSRFLNPPVVHHSGPLFLADFQTANALPFLAASLRLSPDP